MKQCSGCLKDKDDSCYHKQSRVASGLQSLCKPCRRELDRKLYNKNKTRRKGQAKKIRAERRQWNIELKDDKACTDCGTRYPYYVLHWDHIPGHRKVINVSRMLFNATDKQKVLDEIAKCELVCANCHATRTHKRQQHK